MSQPQPLEHITDSAPLQLRSRRRAAWFWIDNALIRQHARWLGPIGVTLYVALASYANQESQQCWPSVVRLSRELGLTRLTIRRYLARLEARGLIQLTSRAGYSFVVTLLEVPTMADVPGCLPGEQVGGEGCFPDEGGDVYPVHRGCLPGAHEPDLMDQKEEPSPKPPDSAHAQEEGPLGNPETANLTTSDSTRTLPDRPDDALRSLDASTRAALEVQAREALLTEGVRVDHLIKPVIEVRMLALWHGQDQESPARGQRHPDRRMPHDPL